MKTPKLFLKPIPEKLFEKKFVKYIEHNKDKEFLRSSFEFKAEAKDKVYTLKKDLDEDALVKLTALANAIKENRALPVNIIPLFAVALAVAGAVVFFTTFMNPILERALERGLESVFDARAEVTNFKLNILRFRVSISSIIVANSDRPMTNLFELSRVELRLLPQAVLRGKIYIEEIRADGIRFGTRRTVSGALPGAAERKAEKAKEKASTPPLVDFKNFDAKALLEREYNKLNSIKVYDNITNFYKTSETKWKEEIEASKKRVNEIKATAKTFQSFDVKSVNLKNTESVNNLLKLIKDANAAIDLVDQTLKDADRIVKGVETDIKEANSLRKAAEKAVSDDIAHLKSYIDIKSGAYREILDPILREILSQKAQDYIMYGKRVLSAADKLKQYSKMLPKKKEDEKPKKEAFKGRDVPFPTRTYPFFYMGVLATDVTVSGFKSSFDLRNVTSDPDLIGRPLTLKLGFDQQTGDKVNVHFNGQADLRTKAKELFNANVDGANFPLSISTDMDKLGIEGFKGKISFGLNVSGMSEGNFSVGLQMNINAPSVEKPKGIVAEAIGSSVKKAGKVDLGVKYVHLTDEKDDFSVTTNIDKLVLDALKQMAAEYAKKAAAEIEKQLRAYIAKQVNESVLSAKDMDALFALAKGDKTALEEIKKSLQVKVKEMEKKALERAQDKAQDAVKDALKGLKLK